VEVQVGEVQVGTCSWTDPTLIEDGSFYPKKTMTLLEQPYLPFRLAAKDLLDLSFQMFSSALRPAQWSNKLGAVLFQFPPIFSFSKENMDYILTCKEKLFDYRLAIEFRHPSWLSEENRKETAPPSASPTCTQKMSSSSGQRR
jgi:uncharacterized protein YecE (DUF72 family)